MMTGKQPVVRGVFDASVNHRYTLGHGAFQGICSIIASLIRQSIMEFVPSRVKMLSSGFRLS